MSWQIKQINSLRKRPLWMLCKSRGRLEMQVFLFLEDTQDVSKDDLSRCWKLYMKCHGIRSVKALENQVLLPGILKWAYKLNFKAVLIWKHT